MSVTRMMQKQAVQRLTKDGTMARIDARKQRLDEAAVALGYAGAQEAFNALGKAFLASVK